MGTVEKNAYTRRKLGHLEKGIVLTLKASGVLAVALLAPNLLKVIPRSHVTRFFERNTSSALTRLAQKGLISFSSGPRGKSVRLTEAGEKVVSFQKVKQSVRTAQKWDKQWRVIIFDIPEARRTARRQLRAFLQEFGWYRLQDSVWVSPYDSEELLTLIKVDLRIMRYVLYMVVSSLENDVHLRKHFGVSD